MLCLSHILGMVQWYQAETPTSNWTEFSNAKKEQYRARQGSRSRRAVQGRLKIHEIFTATSLYHQEVILLTDDSLLTRHHYLHQHNIQNASSFVVPPHHLSLYKKRSSSTQANYFNHQPKIKSILQIKI